MTRDDLMEVGKELAAMTREKMAAALGEFTGRLKALEDRLAAVPEGREGPPGRTGDRGESGPQGLKGDQGERGADGGLSTDPGALRSGGHSGFQAINLAVHLGASRIVLLGYDTQPTGGRDHYFGAHPHGYKMPFDMFRWLFPSIVAPLEALGVAIVNCSRETALDCFPRRPLHEGLS